MLCNMKIQRITTIAFAVCLLGVFAGCGREHPVPPSERNSLILRFFDSMANGDAVAASEQGAKLRAMDPGNDYIVRLVAIQQSNTYLQRAQREVNSGNIDRALDILNGGVKAYPGNRELARQRGRVRQLRNAKMLLGTMREAKTPAAMSAALTAASTGLSAVMTPKLQGYFARYRLRINAAADAEAAKIAPPPVKTPGSVPGK